MILIIIIELLVIFYMIYDNLKWQQKILKSINAAPKPKIKLKKGQKIVFSEKEGINPFE